MGRRPPGTGSTPGLGPYQAKRDFAVTAEPSAAGPPGDRPGVAARRARGAAAPLSFVIQKHAASRLHYDFRLELDGVLASWAVPKGPSLDPSVRRLAVRVEDHPLAYASFEGTIPEGQYGAGTVIVWDCGTWLPDGDPREGLRKGKLAFTLSGHKLQGSWELIRTAPRGRQEQWLLFKKRDAHARASSTFDVVAAQADSVLRPRARTAAAQRAPSIAGAVRAALPKKLLPQLATLATRPPLHGEWSFEVKFDGYRLMIRIEGGHATLITRGGHDWSAKLPGLKRAVEGMGVESAWLDGEIVVLGADGLPDFNALQNAFDRGKDAGIVYFLFDLPFADGEDLRAARLDDRRTRLRQILQRADPARIRYSEPFFASADAAIASACGMNLEGLIAKRLDSPYVSRRSDNWLKLKCRSRQAFIICGYTDRSDGSPQIGSLLLGVHDDDGRLMPAGSVGTGWTAVEAGNLKSRLAAIATETSPMDARARGRAQRWRASGQERWVAPDLVAEVEFAGWTPDGSIRHAVYASLRVDKPATRIIRQRPHDMDESPPVGKGKASRRRVSESEGRDTRSSRAGVQAGTADAGDMAGDRASDIRITHGERIVDPATRLTKLSLTRYYQSVADWILPHLRGRPVSLLRAPDGITGELFFQKHGGRAGIPGVKALNRALSPEHEPLLEVADAAALAGAAQMNVIEFHTWNSTVRSIDRPDRMVFDLDPGEGLEWGALREGALLVRSFLGELGLLAWLKTSGGKGLHLVVPLTRRLGYDAVKDVSRTIVQHLAKTVPSRFVARSGAANRRGKLFVDYLRNGRGATTVAAFSARARAGLGVSMPVDWADLPRVQGGDQWTVADARDYLSLRAHDPWADYWTHRQTLTTAIRLLDGARPKSNRK